MVDEEDEHLDPAQICCNIVIRMRSSQQFADALFLVTLSQA